VVIVDTTVWVDYLKGTATPEVEWLERELTNQRLGLTDLALALLMEIRSGGTRIVLDGIRKRSDDRPVL
jgi:hypothetical protein